MNKRQRKRPPPDLDPIRTFDDACAEAFALSDAFKRGHTAALLDDEGCILDMTVFTRDFHTIDTALEWTQCGLHNIDGIERIVLFSVVDEVGDLKEDDLRVLQLAREVFGRSSVEIVDWIQCDGDKIRSLAFSESQDAWEV